jgi:hypothetical protein
MDTAKYFQNGLPELAEIWYGWLQKKRELSEKVPSDFIKFL